MRFKKAFFFTALSLWLVLVKADQEKLPDDFFQNAELYEKIDMIEQLTVLDNISEKDLNIAQENISNKKEVSP